MPEGRFGSRNGRTVPGSAGDKPMVIYLTNIISPYRIPLYNYLQQTQNFNFRVIALAEKEANREWQIAKEQITFDYHVLPGLHKFIWSKEIPIHLNWGLWRVLRRYKPDVIITSGYDSLAYWEAFLYCKLFKKQYILWNGTTLLSVGSTRGLVGRMKRFIIRGADRYVTYGTKAAEYLEYMGAPRERIQVGVNTVDMDWYRGGCQTICKGDSFRADRSKYPPTMLLYVGRLANGKNIDCLLKAVRKLQDPDLGLFIVGNGPQEKELQEFCQLRGLHNVYFEGFHQQLELPQYYAMADVLILPSVREVWGLVVNEALAGGLYVLCSDQAGAAYDLIKKGWNGELFDPRDVEQLARLIQQTKEQIEEIRKRREAISEHACRKFSIERSAKAFLDAIRTVMEEQA